ncbi:TPA: portal protein [Stenotrophomonas maltophilia]
MDIAKLQAHCRRRKTALKEAQNDWTTLWRQTSEYIDPTRGRFYGDQDDKPRKRNWSKVINSTATDALCVMAAGMMSHMTPKAQPWFKVTTPDPAIAEQFGVRVWLDDVAQRIRDTLASSNFYKAMPVVYAEDGIFGVAPLLVLEDSREVVRFYALTAGNYAVGLDDQGRVDSLWRRYPKTARQLEERYGADALPAVVRDALTKNGDQKFWVESLIEPNTDQRPGIGPLGLQAPRFRPYREVVWIDGAANGQNGVIDIGGHYEAPFVVARWNPVAEDIYSSCPAISCLGDIKQLQYLEGEKLRLMEQVSDPTLGGPESMRRTGGARLRKGGMIYLPQDSLNATIAPVYTPDPRGVREIREEIAVIEQRIQRAFFYQLFLMLEALGDKTDRTATEIVTRKEEKAAVLAPTLESITDEVLDPVVVRVFRLLERAGRIPDPPQVLANVPLKIEYTSILAQAAKAAAVGSIERTMTFVANVAQATGDPSVMDKLDSDQVVDEYTAAVGGPASIIRSDDAVARIRADRAQQQRQQQLAASAQPMKDAAQALKTASDTVPEEGSAAQALIDAMQGAA